ncbi:hypothetical protein HYR99_09420 [Candidatus Poribacteria bacterium]|nr:hypothetical protein [Candidatus Poribacteria bacterium]
MEMTPFSFLQRQEVQMQWGVALIVVLLTCQWVLPASAKNLVWEQTNGPYGGEIRTLVGTRDGTLYAGILGGVYCSNDRGKTWRPVNTGLKNRDVTSLVASPSLLAGSAGVGADTTLYVGTPGGVFRSHDGGDTWTPTDTKLTEANVRSLSVLDKTLYAGTLNGVYRSEDGGDTWTQANTGLTHTSVLALAVLDSTLYAGTLGGGVYRSKDRGETWSNAGLTDADVMALVVFEETLYAGTDMKGGFRFKAGQNIWSNIGLTDVSIWSLAVLDTTLYVATSSGIFRSESPPPAGGRGGQPLGSPRERGGNGKAWTPVNAGLTTTNVFSLLALDGMLYAGTDGSGVFRSEDKGKAWTQVSTGLTPPDVTSLAVGGSTLYASTLGGGAYRSEDKGKAWMSMGMASPDVFSLLVWGTNLYAGTLGSGVFQSADGGKTWVNTGLIHFSVYSLLALDGTVYAGTDGGIFRFDTQSTLASRHCRLFPPYPPVHGGDPRRCPLAPPRAGGAR